MALFLSGPDPFVVAAMEEIDQIKVLYSLGRAGAWPAIGLRSLVAASWILAEDVDMEQHMQRKRRGPKAADLKASRASP